MLDQKEAPKGFYALLKKYVITPTLGNICSACDWRSQCKNPDTDLTVNYHRCMDYVTISKKDGHEIKRNDGCSVVFKRESTIVI